MMDTHEQIRMSVEKITPKRAERYLKQNDRNRKLSPKTVAKYAKSIRTGEWQVNGQSIIFSADGRLLDGQHRLSAVVVAGKPIETCVIRGIQDGAFKTIDGQSSVGDKLIRQRANATTNRMKSNS